MRTKRSAALLAMAALLTACVGRDPNPVRAVQPGDSGLSCAALQEEYEFNIISAKEKIARNENKDATDLMIGVVGFLLFWPLMLTIDMKNAEGQEANALLDRNQRLLIRARAKGCDVGDWGALPERYS